MRGKALNQWLSVGSLTNRKKVVIQSIALALEHHELRGWWVWQNEQFSQLQNTRSKRRLDRPILWSCLPEISPSQPPHENFKHKCKWLYELKVGRKYFAGVSISTNCFTHYDLWPPM